jgi:hypothetical protein
MAARSGELPAQGVVEAPAAPDDVVAGELVEWAGEAERLVEVVGAELDVDPVAPGPAESVLDGAADDGVLRADDVAVVGALVVGVDGVVDEMLCCEPALARLPIVVDPDVCEPLTNAETGS